MKVDLVISSMIQQIDRNLQSQLMPALSWRAGEILRGRVMLAADDSLQIRLDSGALLDALPAGDVLLATGSTVTLRVTGRMDGRFVMQLLGQELDAERPAPAAREQAISAAERQLLDATPQGRAVAEAARRMRLPVNDGTARAALDILQRFPGLQAEKAVFMAANGIAATPESVEALNRLVDGRATTGAELTLLADILTSEAIAREQAAAPPQTPATASAPSQTPATESIMPQTPASASATAQAPAAAAGAPAQQDGAVARLESLVFTALGTEAAESASVVTELDKAGLAEQAVKLALGGMNMNKDEFAVRVKAFARMLPETAAPEAEAFLRDLAAGLARAAKAGSFDAAAFARPAAGHGSLPRVVAEIGRLFARIDSEDAAGTLMKASEGQKAAVQSIAGKLGGSGYESPAAAEQMKRIVSHVQLIDDISRYAYRQIPVDLHGRRTTAELYVLNGKRRGSKSARSDSASILVALETVNLGRVEALAEVSRKVLRLRFGLERAELTGFVDSRMAELGRAMQAIGYQLSGVSVQVIRKPVTLLNIEEQAGPEPRLSGALDVRL